MAVGQMIPAEWREYRDRETGARVRQLTNYRGHSYHLYFTNPGWYDGGRRVLFGSDRDNRSNLFGLDLESGEITQLTDLPAQQSGGFQTAFVNPTRDEAYFAYRQTMIAVDLQTGRQRALWTLPDGFRANILSCTADGQCVCLAITEDLSDRMHLDLGRGYVGMRENWEARPLSRIMIIPAEGGPAEVVWEEHYWIGHVNASPTQPHLLSFCHEGPWALVDHRIWGLDLHARRPWKIRECAEGECVGHEYWYADGITIGYHGKPTRKDVPASGLMGRIRYDNTEQVDVRFPHGTGHIHSNDHTLIVGDAFRHVRLWRWNGIAYDGPRALCEHRSSMHTQMAHVHPRFTPSGDQVLYTSDTSGYGNLYLADVPPFDDLPEIGEG